MPKLTLRDMQNGDLAQVLIIERNAHIAPWSRLSFETSLTQNHICRVLRSMSESEQTSSIRGFHIVCPIVDELHILNVAVAPDFQGQGLAHELMQDIIDIAQQRRLERLFLEVRSSNHIAQSLYRKWGFESLSVRKAYYQPANTPTDTTSRQREDAIVMTRSLPLSTN